MNIFTAPILSLFSLNFYRRAAQSSLWKGIMYLLFLSLLGTILMIARGIPLVDDFMTWFKSDMPSLTWSQAGLQIKGENPYVMAHPALGNFAIFDTSKTDVPADQIGDTLIYVTSTKLYLRQGPNDIATYDLTRPVGGGAAPAQPVEVTPALIEKNFNSFKPLFFTLSFVILYLVFFITQIFTSVIYSLAGMGINLLRQSRLRYGAVLNIAMFALTPAWLIQILRVIIPATAFFPFGIIGSLLVTILYLFLAIKMTDSPPKAA